MQNQLPAPTASGSLAKTPLPHLLVYALERRLSGTFELAWGETHNASILVSEGFPAKVRTSEPVAFLGTVMSELGLITLAQLEASLGRMQESPRLQGEILIALGAVDAAKLEQGLRAQVERKIEHLCTLPPETTFAFYEGVDVLARYGGPPTPIDPLAALWRGVREHPSLEHVELTIQRIGAAALRASNGAQLERFAFSPKEREVALRLGSRPVALSEITDALGMQPGRVLAYFLMIMKQVELRDLPSLADVPPEPVSESRLVTTPDAEPSSSVPPPSPHPSSPPRAPLIPPPGPPSSGQAFARLQLRQTATARNPRAAVEERVVTPAAHDPRASTPGMASVNPGPVPLTEEQTAQRAKIVARAEAISSENYFQMLGVAEDAPTEQIQKAFFALVKVWHPDRLSPALGEVKDACSKVFSHLTEAHATLTDATKRQQYAMLIKDGGATPDDQAKIQAIVEAATEFQKADFLLKRNASDPKAFELIARAVELDDQPEYVATLTWLQAQKVDAQDRAKVAEKIAMLDQCISRAPRLERAYFYRGMLHKRIGDMTRALDDFKRSSEINPKNLDAVREVRVFNMRQGGKPAAATAARPSAPPSTEKRSEGGGLLGKLFKK